jgi:hypothetical protein
MGFVGLVIIPALILSMIFNRLIKEPVENSGREDHAAFKISSGNIRSDLSVHSRKQ